MTRPQVVKVAPSRDGPKELRYDAEWLSVLRATHHLLTPSVRQAALPAFGGAR